MGTSFYFTFTVVHQTLINNFNDIIVQLCEIEEKQQRIVHFLIPTLAFMVQIHRYFESIIQYTKVCIDLD